MTCINDWFNNQEFSTPYELEDHFDSSGDPAQYTGHSYSSDYNYIYVQYTGDHSFTWDCQTQNWEGEEPK